MKLTSKLILLLFFVSMVSSCGSTNQQKETEEQTKAEQEEIYRLEGTINEKYAVHMILDLKNLIGAYYYDKSGVDNFLTLKIHSYNPASGQLTIDEFNNKNELTGEFSGILGESGFKGTAKFGTKTMPFDLAMCTDSSTKYPPLDLGKEVPAISNNTTENVTETLEDENSGTKPPFEFKVETDIDKMNNTEFRTETTYQLLSNGRLKVKKITYSRDYYFTDKWEVFSSKEIGGKWSTTSISRGEGYQRVYMIDRADSDKSMYLPDDTEYIWYDYFDCENYDLKRASKVLDVKKL